MHACTYTHVHARARICGCVCGWVSVLFIGRGRRHHVDRTGHKHMYVYTTAAPPPSLAHFERASARARAYLRVVRYAAAAAATAASCVRSRASARWHGTGQRRGRDSARDTHISSDADDVPSSSSSSHPHTRVHYAHVCVRVCMRCASSQPLTHPHASVDTTPSCRTSWTRVRPSGVTSV